MIIKRQRLNLKIYQLKMKFSCCFFRFRDTAMDLTPYLYPGIKLIYLNVFGFGKLANKPFIYVSQYFLFLTHSFSLCYGKSIIKNFSFPVIGNEMKCCFSIFLFRFGSCLRTSTACRATPSPPWLTRLTTESSSSSRSPSSRRTTLKKVSAKCSCHFQPLYVTYLEIKLVFLKSIVPHKNKSNVSKSYYFS